MLIQKKKKIISNTKKNKYALTDTDWHAFQIPMNIFRIPTYDIIILIKSRQNCVIDNELDVDAFIKLKTKRFQSY